MKLHPEYNDNQMVVAYYRYSSSSQNEASIEQQRQMVQRWAKAQGLVVVSEYEDAAKTGTNADRPGYQLMLRELPKIKPAYARSGRTTVSHEIEPSYCSPSKRSAPSVLAFITSRGSPPHRLPRLRTHGRGGRCVRRVLLAPAVASIRRGQRYNAERALSNGHKIFGFTVDEDKRYIEHPETAPIVTQIFDDYAHNVSMQKICNRLNAQDVCNLVLFRIAVAFCLGCVHLRIYATSCH